MALLTFMTFTLFRGAFSGEIYVVNIPTVAQLVGIGVPPLRILCGDSHHIVLFGKKKIARKD